MSSRLRQILSELLADVPVTWGLASLEDDQAARSRMERIEEWTDSGRHATMDWLARSREVRADPRREWPWARSALVVRLPHALEPLPEGRSARPRIACYARGRDYHRVLEDLLRKLGAQLKERLPDLRTLTCVDVMPVPEVDLAVRAGLGWRGKHTLLISREAGSAANLGVVLLSEPLQELTETVPDFCGNCTACIDACPPKALLAPGKLDAGLCLSHWNIEDRETSEGPAARAARGEVLGCDICQQVCPWNRRHLAAVPQPEGWPDGWEGWISALRPGGGSGPFTKKTPLERVGRAKLRHVLLRTLMNIDPERAAVQRNLARQDETHPRLRAWLEGGSP